MKAAVVPKIDSRWEVKEVPAPEPGPNQVLIKIHASGLCFTDVHQTRREIPGEWTGTFSSCDYAVASVAVESLLLSNN